MNVGDDGNSHRRRVRLAIFACLLVAGWVVAGLFLWRSEVPDLDLPSVEAHELFSPETLADGEAFRSGGRAFWAGAQALQLAVLGVLAWRCRALARWVGRRISGAVRLGVLMGIASVLVVWLAQLPLGAGSHAWRRIFDVTQQGYGAWLLDRALSLLVLAVLVGLAAGVFVWLARRLGQRWWAAGGALLAVGALAFVVLQPLVIQPLFNDFRELRDPALAAEIRAIAEELDVAIDAIEVRDQSRRTSVANAQVTGIGPSTRVVIDDTLLAGDAFRRAEVVAVAAHELAHVSRAHVFKGVAWFGLFAIPAIGIVALVTGRRDPRGLANPALVPLALLTVAAIVLVTAPLQMAISRHLEVEADWIALQATKDPEALERLVSGFVVTNVGDPTRPAWVTHLLGSHPDTLERIGMARLFGEQLGEQQGPSPAGAG
ncbi:MAG: M48 family metalloprotease [Actinomycetia bacterium]|nr:M48 family metalloprotease [Actinomycetes bacterium]